MRTNPESRESGRQTVTVEFEGACARERESFQVAFHSGCGNLNLKPEISAQQIHLVGACFIQVLCAPHSKYCSHYSVCLSDMFVPPCFPCLLDDPFDRLQESSQAASCLPLLRSRLLSNLPCFNFSLCSRCPKNQRDSPLLK